MSMRRTKKRRKSSRDKGTKTVHGGARKKRKKSGHKSGVGLSGSGKRADHKKTFITKVYGHGYFGKQGITSKKTKRDIRKRLNVGEISLNMDSLIKKGLAKKGKNGIEIDLSEYKILGNGEVDTAVIIKAESASKSALKKIEKAGGKVLTRKKEK